MTNYRITFIEPQKRFPNRRNIYLDDAFAFGLDEEVVLKHHLHEGDDISDEMIQHILLEEETTRAKQKALSLLSYRARSIKEIRDRLCQRGYSDPIVDRIVDDFKRVGLLNDDAFASAYVQTRMVQRPVGKRLLIQELMQKGIEEAAAVRAAELGYDKQSEIDVAKALIEPRLSRYQNESFVRIRKKISDFLLRRGFDWEVIGEVVEWVKKEKMEDTRIKNQDQR